MVSPATSGGDTKRSSSHNEDVEPSSSKRKRSGGGHQPDDSIDSDVTDDRDGNRGARRPKRALHSGKGTVGQSSLVRTSKKGQREGAIASLLVLIDENTSIVDTDMLSLDSNESASTAS